LSAIELLRRAVNVHFLDGCSGSVETKLHRILTLCCFYLFPTDLQDFLVEDRRISRVGDHLTGSLAEPRAMYFVAALRASAMGLLGAFGQ
jgi:hypothetical protein